MTRAGRLPAGVDYERSSLSGKKASAHHRNGRQQDSSGPSAKESWQSDPVWAGHARGLLMATR